MSTSLIFIFYIIRVLQMNQGGDFTAINVYALWATVIVVGVLATVIGTILTLIAFGIIEAARTDEEPDVDDLEDERDKLIELRGARNSYIVVGIGMFIAMGTQVLNMSPLVMFSLLLFFVMIAEIIGSISRLYFYQRGF